MEKITYLRYFLLGLLGVMCVSLTGCYPDQFENPGQWSMDGAPRKNTALMVADKSELMQGHGTPAGSNGVAAAAGVDVAIGGAAGTAAGLQKAPQPLSFSGSTGN